MVERSEPDPSLKSRCFERRGRIFHTFEAVGGDGDESDVADLCVARDKFFFSFFDSSHVAAGPGVDASAFLDFVVCISVEACKFSVDASMRYRRLHWSENGGEPPGCAGLGEHRC